MLRWIRGIELVVSHHALSSTLAGEKNRRDTGERIRVREAGKGLSPLDPSATAGFDGTPGQLARAAAADEALAIGLEEQAGIAWVALSRIVDDTTAWTTRFQVPTASEDALLVADAVMSQLRLGYPRHRPRPEAPDLSVRPEDYAELIRLKHRLDHGEPYRFEDLERLEAILETSPRFIDAHLFAAAAARSLAPAGEDAALLDKAQHWLEEAGRIDPEHPWIAGMAVLVALDRGDFATAERSLADLAEQAPASASVALYRSHIAERRGDLETAVQEMRRVVAQVPAWRDLLRLAKLEQQLGDIASARAHLEAILERVPGHRFALSRLGALELTHGDLERAVAIYQRLASEELHRSFLTNLGISHFLLGDYEAAAASYRQALELDPSNIRVTYNLAEAEEARGRQEVANALFREVLEAHRSRRLQVALAPREALQLAQCLARLGEPQRAVEIALDVLSRHGVGRRLENEYRGWRRDWRSWIWPLRERRFLFGSRPDSSEGREERTRALVPKPPWRSGSGFQNTALPYRSAHVGSLLFMAVSILWRAPWMF